MRVSEQLARLVEVGVAELAGLSGKDLLAHAADLPDVPDSVVAVHPALVPASRLAALMRHEDKPGFVVHDMGDLDEFGPIPDAAVPDHRHTWLGFASARQRSA